MGRTTENMQNMLPIFAIQPVWDPCCHPPLVGPYVDGGASSSWQPYPTQGSRRRPTEEEPPPTQSSRLPPTQDESPSPPTPPQDEPPPSDPQQQAPQRMPPDLKEYLGDDRFNNNKKNGRAHVCDICESLYRFYTQALPFDGDWLHGHPPKQKERDRPLKEMWEQGQRDFTWVCTICRFAASDYTNIRAYRRNVLRIDLAEERQQRTAHHRQRQQQQRTAHHRPRQQPKRQRR